MITISQEQYQQSDPSQRLHLVKYFAETKNFEVLFSLLPKTQLTGSDKIHSETVRIFLQSAIDSQKPSTAQLVLAQLQEECTSSPIIHTKKINFDGSEIFQTICQLAENNMDFWHPLMEQFATHPNIQLKTGNSYNSKAPTIFDATLKTMALWPIKLGLIELTGKAIVNSALLNSLKSQINKKVDPNNYHSYNARNNDGPFGEIQFSEIKQWASYPRELAYLVSLIDPKLVSKETATLVSICAPQQYANFTSPEALTTLRNTSLENLDGLIRQAVRLQDAKCSEEFRSQCTREIDQLFDTIVRARPDTWKSELNITASVRYRNSGPTSGFSALLQSTPHIITHCWNNLSAEELWATISEGGQINPTRLGRICDAEKIAPIDSQVLQLLTSTALVQSLGHISEHSKEPLFHVFTQKSSATLFEQALSIWTRPESNSKTAIYNLARDDSHWILTHLNLRKKGDALALCVGIADQNKTQALLRHFPHLPRDRAQETLKYLSTRNTSQHAQALSAFEALLFSEMLLSSPSSPATPIAAEPLAKAKRSRI